MKINKHAGKKQAWHFMPEEKDYFIEKLTDELPVLRSTINITQEDLAEAVGISRQTYNAIEGGKRKMSWNTYLALLMFFDYNPRTHIMIRRLEIFPEIMELQQSEL